MKHGTFAAYQRQKCRCDECRHFWYRYQTRWRSRTGASRHTGKYGPKISLMAPASGVIHHINLLRESGWTLREISREIGRGDTYVGKVLSRKTVQPATAAAIYSVQPLVKDEAPDEVTVERLTKPGVHWRSIPCTREERLAALEIVKERAKGRAAYRQAGWGDQDIEIEGVSAAKSRLGLKQGMQ